MKRIPAYLGSNAFNSYTEENHDRKLAFHRDGKKILKQLAIEIGLQDSEYDLRSNMGGMAVSGEVTLHAEHLYLQMSENMFRPGIAMLYRSCKNRQDYCGGANNNITVLNLNNPDSRARFVEQCKKLIQSVKATAEV